MMSIQDQKTQFNLNKENVDDHAEESKLKELKRRFDNLGTNFKKKQKKTASGWDKTFQDLQDQLEEYKQNQVILHLQNDNDKLVKQIEEENERKTNFDQSFQKKTQILREDYEQSLEGIKIENRGIIKEFNREAEEKLGNFSVLLKKDNLEFHEALQKQQQRLNTEFDRVRRDAEIEQSERKEKLEKLEEEIMDQISTLEEELSVNQQVRNETNNKIRQMIESLGVELERRIEKEQRERENSNNSLLNLLEESCNKIENYFA